MRAVGMGVKEIRIRTGREHRVIYVARFGEAIYVLHAFEKKARRTGKAEMIVARQRLAQVIQSRRDEQR